MADKSEKYRSGEEMEMTEINDFTDGGNGKPLQFDAKFKGPISNRSCTDIICCLIFVVFVVGMAVVGYFAFSYGNPRLLLYPMNSNKELCGYGNQKGKNNLVFFDLISVWKDGPGVFVDGCPTTQICVEECPKKNTFYKFGVLGRCCSRN